ncbi:MAG: amidohydrolase family protein, partial [Chloroflexi bacterium]|nr:amidohydrolase family protein [Chloroflexota bacterium]
ERAGSLAPEAVLVLVTNPLDIMVALSLQRSRFPRPRVMGMAGILDSARLRTFVAERLHVAPSDVEAMVQALREGVIDVIATDHAPHSRVEKLTTLDEADFGISVLETALGSCLSLFHAGEIGLPLLIEKMTAAPARFLGREELGTLREGAAADITIFDPDTEWTVDAGSFASKGKNTPLDGATLKGRVVATIVSGEVVYEAGQIFTDPQ